MVIGIIRSSISGPTLAATFSGILVHWAITLGTIRKEKSKV